MNDYLIYLTLPPYLAQWYANECTKVHNRDNSTCPREIYQFPAPVKPVGGSLESKLLERYLEKQPNAVPAPVPEGATIAIAIPVFKNKHPMFYNYLPPMACNQLANIISSRFNIELFQDLHQFKNVLRRQNSVIDAWMENHCIEYNDTNWNAIAKIYQRQRDCYRHLKAAKKK